MMARDWLLLFRFVGVGAALGAGLAFSLYWLGFVGGTISGVVSSAVVWG